MGTKVAGLTVGLVLIASSGFADGLRRWRTPDGGWYFGDTPPEGSTFMGEAPKLGTVGDGWVAKEREEPAADAAPETAPPLAQAGAPVAAEPVAAPGPGDQRRIRAGWQQKHEALMGRPTP